MFGEKLIFTNQHGFHSIRLRNIVRNATDHNNERRDVALQAGERKRCVFTAVGGAACVLLLCCVDIRVLFSVGSSVPWRLRHLVDEKRVHVGLVARPTDSAAVLQSETNRRHTENIFHSPTTTYNLHYRARFYWFYSARDYNGYGIIIIISKLVRSHAPVGFTHGIAFFFFNRAKNNKLRKHHDIVVNRV